jgi:hypothetical protein
MRFTTATGSTYEIDGDKVRRVGAEDNGKRADGEWVQLLNTPEIEVGRSALLILECLSSYGPDDEGNLEPDSPVTFRRTSAVVSVA